MIKRHLEDILTAIVTGATTARANGFKTVAQKISRDAGDSATRSGSRLRSILT